LNSFKPDNKINENLKSGNLLIDLDSGPMSVILYQDENNKTKIASTLFEPKINTQAIFESNTDQLKEKITDDRHKNDKELLKKLLKEIEIQLDEGKETAVLQIGNQEVKISLQPFKNNYKRISDEVMVLINAIIKDHDMDLNEDVNKVYITSKNFSNYFSKLIKEHFKRDDIVEVKNDIDTMKALSNEDSIKNISSTLNSTIGIGVLGGRFSKQLLRGQTLPCKNISSIATVSDNQTCVALKILQGERSFQRYCFLLGTLQIEGLREAKAGKVSFDVTVEIDKDETLVVTAIEPRENKKLKCVIEKGKIKPYGASLITDAQLNLNADTIALKKVEKISDIIRNARDSCEGKEFETKVREKMNMMVNWMSDRDEDIDKVNLDEKITEVENFMRQYEKIE